MSILKTAITAVALSICFSVPVQASIINGSFEASGGSFLGWTRSTTSGTVLETAAFGSGPTDGGHQALLISGFGTGAVSTVATPSVESALGLTAGTLAGVNGGDPFQGSYIYQDITVSAGDEVFFDWNFLTNEGTPSIFNDFGFFSVSGPETVAMLLGDTISPMSSSSSAAFSDETGFFTGSYMFSTGGTYRIGFGVMDEGDFMTDSGLLVDNVRLSAVPEPASMAIWTVAGLAGFTFVRRRLKK